MKWNAFSLLSPALEKTKKRVLPFSFTEWFKLGYISSMSADSSGSGGNFNSGSGGGSGGGSSGSSSSEGSAGDVSNLPEIDYGLKAKEFFSNYGVLLGAMVLFMFLIGLIFSYIKNVFTFIFVNEVIENKKLNKKGAFGKVLLLLFFSIFVLLALMAPVIISVAKMIISKTFSLEAINISYIILALLGYFIFYLCLIYFYVKVLNLPYSKNNSKGISLFLFKFILNVIILLVVGLVIAYPIYNYFANGVISWLCIFFGILFLIIFFILVWFWLLFLYDLVVPYMYVKEVPALFGLKMIWANIKKNKVETLVYWLSRIVIGLAIAILMLLIGLLVFLAIGLVGLLFLGIGVVLYASLGLSTLLIIYSLVCIGLLIVLAGVVNTIIFAPFNVFLKYFGLLNFEALTKIKILKF